MNWDEFVAPRHGGKVNVLYANGAVEDVFPGEIDPTTEEGLEKWRP
jgi:hypothetical protein